MKAETVKMPAHGGKKRAQQGAQADARQNTVKVEEETPAQTGVTGVEAGRVSPQMARRILYSLMLPAMIMPVSGSMARVALPIIRDDFGIPADMTAWVAAAFMLPFMVLMPLYGRLSDVVGRRRLLLLGIAVFTIGTVITLMSTNLGWLLAGRAVQGIGGSGLMPLGMAFISAIFSTDSRGKALGTWSQVGPSAGFIGPLIAGVIIGIWGWRAAFFPPLLVGIAALLVVYYLIPSGLSTIEPGIFQRFDWPGVVLLAGAGTSFVFYLSSRPITGVAPLRDWRLLLLAVIFFALLVWWERRRPDSFIPLEVFHERVFLQASGTASMRMVTMAGLGFLVPLYVVDVHGLSASAVGVMLVINPGAMALMVRQGGKIADRWGSRLPVLVGLSVQISVALLLFFLPGTAPVWTLGLILAFHGLGAGLMLAALHRAAMGDTEPEQMGSVAGMYSMLRFAGMVVGTTLAGVILQHFLDRGLPTLEAYQWSFLCMSVAGLTGIVIGASMQEPRESQTAQGAK